MHNYDYITSIWRLQFFAKKKKKVFNRKIFKIRNTKASLFFIFLKFDWILQTALEV